MFNLLKRLLGNSRGEHAIVPATASPAVANTRTDMLYVAPKVESVIHVGTNNPPVRPALGNTEPIPWPLNIFGFVLPVLESRYPALAQSIGRDINDKLMTQLQAFRDGYLSLDQEKWIDYSTELSRFAYVYGYAPVRANAIYDALRQTPEIQPLFDLPEVRVSCIGGGPGSDLLGISKHLARRERVAKLTHPVVVATVCDQIAGWKVWWEAFEQNLRNGPSCMNIQARYRAHNILDSDTWEGIEELTGSHLYTISYCMGEFRVRQKAADPYLQRVIGGAATGAWFVFVDNNHPRDFEWFNDLCEMHKLTVMQRSAGVYKPEHTELDVAAASFNMKYGDACTNMTINRAVRVCVKS